VNRLVFDPRVLTHPTPWRPQWRRSRDDEETIDLAAFAITHERLGTTVRIAASGELDIATSPLLREACAREQRNGADVILVDLSDVTFMDSTGLHALLAACRGGDQRLRVILGTAAARVIDITELRDTMPIIQG
jgi:anti-anti-sigma factor